MADVLRAMTAMHATIAADLESVCERYSVASAAWWEYEVDDHTAACGMTPVLDVLKALALIEATDLRVEGRPDVAVVVEAVRIARIARTGDQGD